MPDSYTQEEISIIRKLTDEAKRDLVSRFKEDLGKDRIPEFAIIVKAGKETGSSSYVEPIRDSPRLGVMSLLLNYLDPRKITVQETREPFSE